MKEVDRPVEKDDFFKSTLGMCIFILFKIFCY